MPWTAAPAEPIGPDEALALFAALLPDRGDPRTPRPVLLAVSGGPDSMAMLAAAALARQALADRGVAFHVATVDHGLRAAAGLEADAVARVCGDVAMPHHRLRWTGPKPTANLQATARAARYGLLDEAARVIGADAILTAHHQDDQVETHVLARRRHAGSRGLAGMRRRRALSPGIDLLRPFLDIPGARMRATAAAYGLPTFDDPSNADLRFDRARLRRDFAAMGAGDRTAMLAEIAVHRESCDRADRALAEALREAPGALRTDPFGGVRIAPERFRALGPDLAADLLGRIVAAVGGGEHPPSRAALARILRDLLGGEAPGVATLGGVRMEICMERNVQLTFVREFGRRGPPEVALDPGRSAALFDRRFRVSPAGPGTFASLPGAARLAGFGTLGRGNAAERTLPVLLDAAGAVVAVPDLLAAKAGGVPGRLAIVSEVEWRLRADLPPPSSVVAGD